MRADNSKNHSQGGRTVRVLDQMIELLELERKALLVGDANSVTELASDKEFMIHSLSEVTQKLDKESPADREVILLVKKISQMTESNHALLQQMYKHYQGMLELLLKISGHGSTYNRNGSVDMDYGPRSNSYITA